MPHPIPFALTDTASCCEIARYLASTVLGYFDCPVGRIHLRTSSRRRSRAHGAGGALVIAASQPTPADLHLAALVHEVCATMPASGRFGDRKVWISEIHVALQHREWKPVPELADFKAWLVRVLPMSAPDGSPLVLLARADLVSAMSRALVDASETDGRGATWHFVLDRAASPEDYAPRPARKAPARPRNEVTLPMCPEQCDRTAWVARGHAVGAFFTRAGVRVPDSVEVVGSDQDKALAEMEARLLEAVADIRRLRADIAAGPES